jgi:hypothetical protein
VTGERMAALCFVPGEVATRQAPWGCLYLVGISGNGRRRLRCAVSRGEGYVGSGGRFRVFQRHAKLASRGQDRKRGSYGQSMADYSEHWPAVVSKRSFPAVGSMISYSSLPHVDHWTTQSGLAFRRSTASGCMMVTEW